MKYFLCVPTYKRPHLLEALLRDVARQDCMPFGVVVVDGDPASGDVLAMLSRARLGFSFKIVYVPSPHANLAYQRYLAYLVARDVECIVYLDDDLRIPRSDAISQLIAPLADAGNELYSAGTGTIVFGSGIGLATGVVADRITDSGIKVGWLVRLLGASTRTAPGGLTPAGNRVLPRSDGHAYANVEWLRGGAMAFRVATLSDDFFSDDLFALTKIGCGLGEDTFLGRRALARGKVYMAFGALFDHPNADEPKAYPTQAFRNGFATAYSRRFINDYYRGFESPTGMDRLSLMRSLLGALIMSGIRLLKDPSTRRAAYCFGFLKGCMWAIFVSPRSCRLCPEINWRSDAASALALSQRL